MCIILKIEITFSRHFCHYWTCKQNRKSDAVLICYGILTRTSLICPSEANFDCWDLKYPNPKQLCVMKDRSTAKAPKYVSCFSLSPHEMLYKVIEFMNIIYNIIQHPILYIISLYHIGNWGKAVKRFLLCFWSCCLFHLRLDTDVACFMNEVQNMQDRIFGFDLSVCKQH